VTPLKRIARLSAAFLGSNLARGAIAFALSLVVGRALGVERFGRWIWCSTWASTLTVVADLGFGLLLPRDGARADADHGALAGSALTLRLAVAIPAAAALYAASWWSSSPESIAGLRVAAVLAVSGAAYGCFGATFRSQPAWVPTVLVVETAWSAAQLIASWIVVSLRPSGVPALLAIAAAVQIAQIASALVLWRFAFGDREPLRVPSLNSAIATLRRAVPFAAAGLVANLQTRIAPLMLGYLSTTGELGSFAAAARFGTTAKLAPGAIFAGALPVLSREYGRDRDGAHQAYRAFDRALILLTVVIAVPCILFAKPILRLVYGESFVRAAPALVWIGIALVPTLMNSGKKVFLYAAGAETTVVRWSAVALIAQAALGLTLMPAFGAVGAAIALAAGETIIWRPLRTALRPDGRSSPRRAPASTPARSQPHAHDVPGPAAAR
jgi:O-antigen/teichoic acid export membrane protein